jgi:kumamolisin
MTIQRAFQKSQLGLGQEDHTMDADYLALRGSERPQPILGAGLPDPAEHVVATLVLRRREDGPALPDLRKLAIKPPLERVHLSRAECAERYGASPADVERVVTFARDKGLIVEETSLARRSVVVSGEIAQFNDAFAVTLMRGEIDGRSILFYSGSVYIPRDLAEIVTAVLDLEDELRFEPEPLPAAPPTILALTPPQVAGLYKFPKGDGAGETIGILEFGGGFSQNDIDQYFSTIVDLPTPSVTFYSVDGTANTPYKDKGGDIETMADLCVAGSVANGAAIVIYRTSGSFYGALAAALHDHVNKPSVLSISWGIGHSDTVAPTVAPLMEDALMMGVTIFACSGDNRSNANPPALWYPSTDPGVTSCGGTTLENVEQSSFDQIGWTGSCGGVTPEFPRPSWQDSADTPATSTGFYGRAIPDIAADGNPSSGYMFCYDGSTIGPIGGTSVATPLYAALAAIINANLGKRIGFLNYYLYACGSIYPFVFDDVVEGHNSAYQCREGWDAVTGWGSVHGMKLQEALANPCWAIQAQLTAAQEAVQAVANSIGSGELPPSETKGALDELGQLVDEEIALEQALAKCRATHPV